MKDDDTDGDGLNDKMEQDGWTVLIIYEATYQEKEKYQVSSDPLDPDTEGDGLNDCYEFENGTDPNKSDTDGDGFSDIYEIEFDIGSSPTGIDGAPPKITDLDCSYAYKVESSGPISKMKIIPKYIVNIDVSSEDLFGLDWINVYLEGIGNKKIQLNNEQSIKKLRFEFTLDIVQATNSLFSNASVNISASDRNDNHGYREEEVPRLAESALDGFIGILNFVGGLIVSLINILIDIVKNIIENAINSFDSLFDKIVKNVENTFKESIDTIKNIGDSILKTINSLSKMINNAISRIEKYIEKYIDEFKSFVFDCYFVILSPLVSLIGLKKEDFKAENIINSLINLNWEYLLNNEVIPEFLINIFKLFKSVVEGDASKIFDFESHIQIIKKTITDQTSEYGIDYEITKGYFTDSELFDLRWKQIAIISLAIDVFNVVLALALTIIDAFVISIPIPEPFHKIISGALWPVFLLITIVYLIPLVLDVYAFLHFWGDEIGLYSTEDSLGGGFEMIAGTFSASILSPYTSALLSYICSQLIYSVASIFVPPLGFGGAISSLVDLANLGMGFFYFSDVTIQEIS